MPYTRIMKKITEATGDARKKGPSSIAAKKYMVVKHFNSQKVTIMKLLLVE